MILYLHNHAYGKNIDSFKVLIKNQHLFNAVGIYFSIDNPTNADYILIGSGTLIDKRKSIMDSVQKALDVIQNLHERNPKAQIILLDSNDSTSTAASLPVLTESIELGYPIKWLLKNQLTTLQGGPFGKWWWSESEIDPIALHPQTKLTGWDLGSYTESYKNFYPRLFSGNSEYDICAIYQHLHDENYEHLERNDIYYTQHRTKPYELLKNSKWNYQTGKRPYDEYLKILCSSKVCLSPFGMGEICYRDFEAMQYCIPIIKPDMTNVITFGDIWKPFETYIPVKADWSNLLDVLDDVLSKPLNCAGNFRFDYVKAYDPKNLIKYWQTEILI